MLWQDAGVAAKACRVRRSHTRPPCRPHNASDSCNIHSATPRPPIDEEFETLPDGRWKQNWAQGEVRAGQCGSTRAALEAALRHGVSVSRVEGLADACCGVRVSAVPRRAGRCGAKTWQAGSKGPPGKGGHMMGTMLPP
jgi:hypothetical protein